MKKTVIINRGIPLSGKSTATKEIVKTLNENSISCMSHSTDEYFMQNSEYIFDQSKLGEYHLKNQDNFTQSLKQGVEVVICDNTNIESWEAKPYYNLAKSFDYNVIIIDYEPRDVNSHMEAQGNNDYLGGIPLEVLESMKQSYNNYKSLTDKNSYPDTHQPQRGYKVETDKVETTDALSEPFYYDSLIKIMHKDFDKVMEIIGNMVLKKIRDYSLNEIGLIPSEYKIIMREFHKKTDKTLTAYDFEGLIEKQPKQIERYINELANEFKNIIKTKVGNKVGYKLVDNFDIFIENFKENEDMEELFYLASESSPELFDKLKYTLHKDDSIYLFKNTKFETILDRGNFNKLKQAIKAKEYRKIKFFDMNESFEVKCIKLVFVDNNWYLAYVDSEDILKLGRVSFIGEVGYASKNSFQKNSIEKHIDNLNKHLQNSLTLFDVKPKIAKIRAMPNIARYFQEDMKTFLSSQKFIRELEDGSVEFSVDYTQPLEILPFIQKWMPDLLILEPKELREIYKEKLQESIKSYI